MKSKTLPSKSIRQPAGITLMRANLSHLQMQLILEVVDTLQEALKASTGASITGEHGISPFDRLKDNEIAEVSFPLQNLGLPSYKNRFLIEAMSGLQNICIEYQGMMENGEEFWARAVAFPTVALNGVENGKSGGSVFFGILGGAAKALFRMNRYSIYLKEVVRRCDSVYAARLYMFLSLWRDRESVDITYVELRSMLGMTEMDKEGKVSKEKYPAWSKFKAKVLEVAEAELKRLYDAGCSDMYFTFREVFRDGRKRGTPEQLTFYIHQCAALATDGGDTRQGYLLHFLTASCGLDKGGAESIMHSIRPEQEEALVKHLVDIKRSVDMGKKTGVKNLAAYITACARKWVESHPDETVPPVKVEGTVRAKWNALMACIRENASEQIMDRWYKPLSLDERSTDRHIGIVVPDITYIEYLENHLDGPFQAVFGTEVKLTYICR